MNLDISAAAWIRTSDENPWYLYLVTPLVEQVGKFEAYRSIGTVVRKISDLWYADPMHIKVIGSNDPLSKDIVEHRDRGSLSMPVVYHGPSLGPISVDEAYIYRRSG